MVISGNLEILLAPRRARNGPFIPGNTRRKDLEALIPYVLIHCLHYLVFKADISLIGAVFISLCNSHGVQNL